MDDKVVFSLEQLAYLKKLFPSTILGPSTPEAVIRQYFGQQSVIAAVESRVYRGNLRHE